MKAVIHHVDAMDWACRRRSEIPRRVAVAKLAQAVWTNARCMEREALSATPAEPFELQVLHTFNTSRYGNLVCQPFRVDAYSPAPELGFLAPNGGEPGDT